MKKIKQIILLAFTIVLISSNFSYAEKIKKDEDFLEAVHEYIMDNYALEVTDEQLYDAAAKGMFKALDPYSTYLTKEEYSEFKEQMNGDFGGIGAVIGKNEQGFYIVSVSPGNPAEKYGIKSMDKIIKVNDNEITLLMTTEELVKQVKGEPGTQVKLELLRDNKPIIIEVTRDVIHINSVESKMLTDDIAYMNILEFNTDTYESVTKAINNLKFKKADKLVLDLRGNPGGSLEQVIEIANYFVPKGKIIEIRYKSSEPVIAYSSGNIKFSKVVVLVDGNTASAAEILSGAIKDTKSGTVLGTTTFGKGIIQDIYELTNGEAIKLTIAKYILPSGKDIHKKGITPDIYLEYVKPEEGSDKDNQLEKAIEILQKQ